MPYNGRGSLCNQSFRTVVHDAQAARIETTTALLTGLLTFVYAIFIALPNDLIVIGHPLWRSDPVLTKSHEVKHRQDGEAAERKDIGQVRVWPVAADGRNLRNQR